jgi:hypothetical protein
VDAFSLQSIQLQFSTGHDTTRHPRHAFYTSGVVGLRALSSWSTARAARVCVESDRGSCEAAELPRPDLLTRWLLPFVVASMRAA